MIDSFLVSLDVARHCVRIITSPTWLRFSHREFPHRDFHTRVAQGFSHRDFHTRVAQGWRDNFANHEPHQKLTLLNELLLEMLAPWLLSHSVTRILPCLERVFAMIETCNCCNKRRVFEIIKEMPQRCPHFGASPTHRRS